MERVLRTLCVYCKKVKATGTDRLCDECRKNHKGWYMYQCYRGNSRMRYGSGWEKLRKKILERDRYLCQECLKCGIYKTATDVDHIVPLAKGGSNDENNLQSLCHECHKHKTCQESKKNINF